VRLWAGLVPMVFNFDKPETKDFTETVRLLHDTRSLQHYLGHKNIQHTRATQS
jgi:hypothetical protein